eukprot:5841429-Pyramimonas_sp.AAC.1
MQGEVFHDGSFLKPGPAVHAAPAWSVVKIDEDGDLVASLSGPVGASLPPTSPAAEDVGFLVATSCPRVTKAWTDFK